MNDFQLVFSIGQTCQKSYDNKIQINVIKRVLQHLWQRYVALLEGTALLDFIIYTTFHTLTSDKLGCP